MLTYFNPFDYLPKGSAYFQVNNHTVLQGLRVENPLCNLAMEQCVYRKTK